MTVRLALLVSILALAGCTKKDAPKADVRAEGEAGAPAPMRVVVFDAAAASAAVPEKDAGKPRDFEDLFAYGGDAGVASPAGLAQAKYESYGNPKYHFTVDVPTSFTAMEEPFSGDGMNWRFGNLAAMAASAMYVDADFPVECANTKNVTSHRNGKNTCWATGKKDGFVFWEHYVLNGGTLYSLRFEYAESVKEAMDPIVKHVSASWSQ